VTFIEDAHSCHHLLVLFLFLLTAAQGMDPTNERMVFETIARCASTDLMPQYFLVTPKLLPDLPFPAEATIFCIFNGVNTMAQKEWNMESFVDAESALKHAST
jgi:hypothetical protein